MTTFTVNTLIEHSLAIQYLHVLIYTVAQVPVGWYFLWNLASRTTWNGNQVNSYSMSHFAGWNRIVHMQTLRKWNHTLGMDPGNLVPKKYYKYSTWLHKLVNVLLGEFMRWAPWVSCQILTSYMQWMAWHKLK